VIGGESPEAASLEILPKVQLGRNRALFVKNSSENKALRSFENQ